MKWYTPAQIKQHASTPTKALNISIKHWQQIVDATAKEIKEYLKHDSDLIYSAYCGLCYFYNNCGKPGCLLRQAHGCGSDPSQWLAVANAYTDWHYDGKPIRNFRNQARKMLKILKSLKGKK